MWVAQTRADVQLMSIEIERVVSADFTHYLECTHRIGRSCKTFYMRCIPLKDMPDGKRKKILVFGYSMWGGEEKKIRYVDNDRLFEREH